MKYKYGYNVRLDKWGRIKAFFIHDCHNKIIYDGYDYFQPNNYSESTDTENINFISYDKFTLLLNLSYKNDLSGLNILNFIKKYGLEEHGI